MEAETVEKKIYNVEPKLRFQEFKEDWEAQKLEKNCTFFSGGTPTSTKKSYYSGTIPFIGSGNIHDEEVKNYITEEALRISSAKIVNEGDLLYALYGANSGDVAISKLKGAINQAILCIRSEADIYFIYSLLNYNQRKIISKYLQGGQGNLSAKIIKNLKFKFPSLPEQQKIASFFCAVDKKIKQLTRKKELLETYKKGVMQKLFSQEIRFKDADRKDFPKWEKKKYGDIYTFLSTNSFSRNDLNYEEGDVKNIHYGDIHTKFPSLFYLSKENLPFINSDKDISTINPENFCQEGDLVIADASEDYKDIGKSIEIIELSGEKVLAGLHTFLARPNSQIMHKGFSGYLVQSWKFRKQVMTIAQGTKVLGLSTGRMKKLKLEIPSVPEQQKIADFLSAIDKKIEAVSQQIEKTQTLKKGLLQQMFV